MKPSVLPHASMHIPNCTRFYYTHTETPTVKEVSLINLRNTRKSYIK